MSQPQSPDSNPKKPSGGLPVLLDPPRLEGQASGGSLGFSLDLKLRVLTSPDAALRVVTGNASAGTWFHGFLIAGARSNIIEKRHRNQIQEKQTQRENNKNNLASLRLTEPKAVQSPLKGIGLKALAHGPVNSRAPRSVFPWKWALHPKD